MSSEPIVALRDATIAHENAPEPLVSGLTVQFPRGFTGVVGANGAGKTTLLRVVAGELPLAGGALQGMDDAVYCEQRTDAPPATLATFLDDWDGEAFELRGRLGVEPDFLARWETLSHGERKRAQIAHALWRSPALLAIDEPTNHVDVEARDLIVENLARYDGVGLIVSHDRDLLDELCIQCVWLSPPTARVFPGGYTQASEQRALELETALRQRSKAAGERKALQREIVRRREKAAREHSARSKRGLDRKDSDAREKIDRARVTDGKAGSGLRQLMGRADQAEDRLAAARVEKQYETGIWLPGSRSRRDLLFTLPPGELPLGGGRVLGHPELSMRPRDRVAVTGPNGAGKTTLLRAIAGKLNVPEQHVTVMPQEVTAALSERVLDEARALPKDRLGHVMNVVSRLGSRPQRLLDSRLPSPGEVRKLLLALGMARLPHLIIMDEPTNHLDLPSIESLEDALADCPCGLLLVSHDRRFLDRLAEVEWRLEVDAAQHSRLVFA